MTARLPLAAALLLLASAALANPNAEAKKEIEALNARMSEAVIKGDAAAVAALYDEHTIVLPDASPQVEGRANTEKLWAGFVKQVSRFELKAGEVQTSGDFAVETGAYTITVGGATQEGKYLVVWKKSHGKWLILRDIWNANAMPKPPEAAPK